MASFARATFAVSWWRNCERAARTTHHDRAHTCSHSRHGQRERRDQRHSRGRRVGIIIIIIIIFASRFVASRLFLTPSLSAGDQGARFINRRPRERAS